MPTSREAQVAREPAPGPRRQQAVSRHAAAGVKAGWPPC